MSSYNNQCKRSQGRCDCQMPDHGRARGNCQMTDYMREKNSCQMTDCMREKNSCRMTDNNTENNVWQFCGKKDWSIGMTYVPMQKWQELYPLDEGFHQGTIFKELDLPFLGRRMC